MPLNNTNILPSQSEVTTIRVLKSSVSIFFTKCSYSELYTDDAVAILELFLDRCGFRFWRQLIRGWFFIIVSNVFVEANRDTVVGEEFIFLALVLPLVTIIGVFVACSGSEVGAWELFVGAEVEILSSFGSMIFSDDWTAIALEAFKNFEYDR